MGVNNANEVTVRYLDACGACIDAHNDAPMASSARLCISDAWTLCDSGDNLAARQRALQGVSYAVGVHHADYCRLAEQIRAYR